MHVTLDRMDNALHFRASNESGRSVDIDGSTSIGGNNKWVRPMRLMLMSLGGCSGIDVVNMLRKQNQPIIGLRISIDGARNENEIPALFKDLQLHYQFGGDLEPARLRRAVE